MPTTSNLGLTLPEPGAESTRGNWGTTINTALTAVDTALADATTSAAGRMSSSDKTKLDGLQQSDWNSSSGGSEILNKPTIPSGNQIIDWTASGVGTIHSSNIPVIALTNVQEASSQSAQLALTTQEGDVVVRTDENKSYVRNSGTTGTMSDFTLLRTPTDAVLSVNGNTGAVTLTHDGFSDFVANEHIDWTSASAGTIHSSNYTTDLSNDTSPQLAANLDVNGNDIVSTSNGNIDLDPNGSGQVVLKGNSTKGSGQIVLNCEVNTHGMILKGPPHSAGATYTFTLPNNPGSADQVLKTDGNGVTSWVDQTGGGGGVSEDTVVALALALG